MHSKELQEIVAQVQKIIKKIAPGALEKPMYGGLVYELKDATPKRLFCGIFVRTSYVTVEFDRGTELQDEQNHLEGKGNNRRHLTLNSVAEVESKNVESYIKQSFQLKP